jgi:hypothetical protein
MLVVDIETKEFGLAGEYALCNAHKQVYFEVDPIADGGTDDQIDP